MSVLKVTVYYTDGRQLEANIGPRAKVEVERRFDIQFGDIMETAGERNRARRLEMLYFTAFSAVRFAGLESESDYDEWLCTIDDVALDQDEAAAANPTGRAAPPATSST